MYHLLGHVSLSVQMAKIQAASVSNQIVNRKRKRKPKVDAPPEAEVAEHDADSTSTTTVPTKSQDGGRKPRRTKAATKPPTLRRNSSTNLVETDIPWPDHFKYLERLHRSLKPSIHVLLHKEALCNNVEQHQVGCRGQHKAAACRGRCRTSQSSCP